MLADIPRTISSSKNEKTEFQSDEELKNWFEVSN